MTPNPTIEELLTAYGLWCQPSRRQQVCGSAEGLFREGPPGSHGLGPPRTPAALAVQVQAVFKRLTPSHRSVLQAEYVPASGLRAGALKQQLGLTWRQWRGIRDEALKAFAAAWGERVPSL